MSQTFQGHKVIGTHLLREQGCYSRVRIFVPGHVRISGDYPVTYVTGLQGPETTIDLDMITPCVSFEVIQASAQEELQLKAA